MSQDGILGVDENGNLDGTIIDSADIIVGFKINNDVCESLGYLSNDNSLTLEATLSSKPKSSTSSFLDYIVETPSVSLSPSSKQAVVSKSESDDDLIYLVTAYLDTSVSKTELVMTYRIDFPSNANIGSSAVDYYGTKLSFSFNAVGVKPEAVS